MFGPDVPGSVKVGVEGKPARPTFKQGLRLTVGAMLVLTLATGLAGVPRIYQDDSHAFGFGLVDNERLQLGKTPSVQTPVEAMRSLASLADISQVLQHNRSARLDSFDDLLGEDVVAITTKAGLLATEDSQTPLGAFGPFGLTGSFLAKDASLDFSPAALAKKTPFISDCGTTQTQVHADGVLVRSNLGRNSFDNDVEEESAVSANKISGADLAITGPGKHLRKVQRNGDSACYRGQPRRCGLPVNLERVDVVARRTRRRMRTRGLTSLFATDESRFYCFRRFDASLDMQVAYQVRQLLLQCTVSQVVKGNPVFLVCGPRSFTDGVERFRKLAGRFQQGYLLLDSRIQQ